MPPERCAHSASLKVILDQSLLPIANLGPQEFDAETYANQRGIAVSYI